MSPAFSSLKQAGGFVLLLLFLLLSPLILPKWALPPRETIYNTIPWNVGPYPFIHDQIYNEKSDVDIAIIGDSQIWSAIDTPYLQQQLSQKLGRPAVVISLCAPWAGFDGLYFLARDLMAHRKIHMLIFSDASGLGDTPQEVPHKQAWRWFRYAEDSTEIAALPLRLRLTYYYGSILGLPRTLISLIRPNLGPILTPEHVREVEADRHWVMPNTTLGTLVMRMDFGGESFIPYTPVTDTQPYDFAVYSPPTVDQFHFAITSPTPSLQTYFAQKLAALATENGTHLACLNIPFLPDRHSRVVLERYNWAEMMHAPVTLIGIPPEKLFDGLSDRDIVKLFWDPYHFNQNGERYFTRLLAPNLITLYDDTTKN